MRLLNRKAMSPKGNKGILCSSTVELIEAFESANKSDDPNIPLKKRNIGSMDAVSLFTRLDSDKSAAIVKEEVLKSKVWFENIYVHELGVYLRKNLLQVYMQDAGYDDLLPKQVKERTKVKGNDADYLY